jgi:hypothetical protein
VLKVRNMHGAAHRRAHTAGVRAAPYHTTKKQLTPPSGANVIYAGMQGMTVMAAGMEVESQQPCRLIVRFRRSIDVNAAVGRWVGYWGRAGSIGMHVLLGTLIWHIGGHAARQSLWGRLL